MKLCSKCSSPYYEGAPLCECGASSTEIDLPDDFDFGDLSDTIYILEEYALPRHIGDKSSAEYAEYVNDLYRQDSLYRVRNGQTPRQIPNELREIVNPVLWKPSELAASKSSQHVPACPICRSTDLTRLSAVKSFLKIATFGLAGAGDVGKAWKYNNCGSRF